MALMSIRDIRFRYDTNVVLNGIALDMDAGEIIMLLGPNGSGKTTLLDCIVGYRHAEAGQILIDGIDSQRYSVGDLAKSIAYVPQSASSIFPYTALEIVLMGRTPYLGPTASPSKDDVSIAMDALYSLNMTQFKDRPYAKLSGGERQLVMIARSLAQDAKIILLDEPTSSLDIKNEAMVLTKIKELVRQTKKSVVIATHQPNHAFYLCEDDLHVNVALFKDGRIKHFGTPNEVLTRDIINEVYSVSCGIYEYKENCKTIIVD
jgi:iron complex transport system ATP-binding protein